MSTSKDIQSPESKSTSISEKKETMKNFPQRGTSSKNDTPGEPSSSQKESKYGDFPKDNPTRTNPGSKDTAGESSLRDQLSTQSPSSLGSYLRNLQDRCTIFRQEYPIWEEIFLDYKNCLQFLRDGLKGRWLLFTIFSVSLTFPYVLSYWDNYRSGFVQREYNNFTETMCESHHIDSAPGCLAENEIKFLHKEHINRFVWTLHLIIAEDGCQNLDPHNTAIHFIEDRPVIEEDIVFDGLMRYFNYTPDDARLLIRTCKIVFEKSYQNDMVGLHYRDQFTYLNDYLMKYCGYKTDLSFYWSDLCVFLVLFIFFYIIYLFVRNFVDSCKLVLLSKYQRNWVPVSYENTSSLTGVSS